MSDQMFDGVTMSDVRLMLYSRRFCKNCIPYPMKLHEWASVPPTVPVRSQSCLTFVPTGARAHELPSVTGRRAEKLRR